MAKATNIRDALKRWEEKNEGQVATEATDIGLQCQWPPIEKMDNTLSTLKNCKKLSLSTNMIERIVGVGGLKNLKILSLARNNIKNLTGMDALGDNLEELWISYNLIERTRGIDALKKLKILYIGNNLIKDWGEFSRFNTLPDLRDFLFIGNPLMESMDEPVYKKEVIRRLPAITKLDGEPIVRGLD